MGGNVALAYLATHPEEAGRLLGLVTIGSQMTMPENRLFVEYLKALALRRKRAFEGIRGVGSALEALGEPAEELFYHRANVEAEVLKRLHEEASDAPGLGLIGQYLGLAQKGELKSSDGKLNYSRLMARVRPPVLLTAGARDRLAPPVVQRHLLRSLGSAEKRLVIFGRKEGFSTDYGHGDPIVGRRALGEIYPLIRDWLRDRAG
jgi:pimeloyl-ACP methyl ester carboxylesterase